MPSFKDKLKKMASDKQIAVHPLVEKLNANQSTRSSYWLAFALYAKVEEQDLDAPLIELGKSLKLDETEIRDELSAVKGCSSDEDFESLVQECAGGLTDAAVKILLAMELDQFSNKNSLDPDFVSTFSDIIELSAEDRSFVAELQKILNAKTPDVVKLYLFLNKNTDKPPVLFDLYCPELHKIAPTVPEFLKEISKEPSFRPAEYAMLDRVAASERVHKESIPFLEIKQYFKARGEDCPATAFFADQDTMEKHYKAVEDAFVKKHSDIPLPLVRHLAFQLYREKLQTLKMGHLCTPEFPENVIEIFVLRCYMRFSAGMKEQFLDDGWRFGRIIDNMYEAPLEEKLQIERKELDAIIAVYEKENEKLTVFFN